jgi:hypothetical protein
MLFHGPQPRILALPCVSASVRGWEVRTRPAEAPRSDGALESNAPNSCQSTRTCGTCGRRRRQSVPQSRCGRRSRAREAQQQRRCGQSFTAVSNAARATIALVRRAMVSSRRTSAASYGAGSVASATHTAPRVKRPLPLHSGLRLRVRGAMPRGGSSLIHRPAGKQTKSIIYPPLDAKKTLPKFLAAGCHWWARRGRRIERPAPLRIHVAQWRMWL